MFAFEWIALAYFAAFLLVAIGHGGRTAAVVAATLIVLIVAAWAVLPVGTRQWFGHLYIALGYWVPAWVSPTAEGGGFEAWLTRGDARCRRLLRSASPALMLVGDIAYLLCYPLVPLSFLVVWSAGSPIDVERYWVAVLLAGYVCYGTLPWLISRPPRLLETGPPQAALARGNAWVLARISHGRNTFPSGHVAVSIAAAIAVSAVSLEAAVIAAVVAAGVALGAMTGRYHFVIDVVAGAAAGVACGLLGYAVALTA